MSVELSPANQLGFPRPLTHLVKRALLIHNPHPHPIAFKVKTTAPKQYCVRPNSGRVESGESIEVVVLLQPLSVEPPPHAKCKDKFLVQSAFITPDDEMRPLGDMWAATEKHNKTAIQEQKIKVAYLAAEDGSNVNGIPEEPEEGHSRMEESFHLPHDGLSRWTTIPDKEYDMTLFRNGGHSYWEVPNLPVLPKRPKPAQIYAAAESSPVHTTGAGERSLPTPPPATPTPVVNGNGNVNASTPESAGHSTIKPEPKELPFLGGSIAALSPESTQRQPQSGSQFTSSVSAPQANNNADTPTEQSSPTPTLTPTKPNSEPDSEKLKAAYAEIDRLKTQLAEAQSATGTNGPSVTGLRKRGPGGETATATAVEKVKEVLPSTQMGSSGVPLEVVVGVAAGVFVLTYLFF